MRVNLRKYELHFAKEEFESYIWDEILEAITNYDTGKKLYMRSVGSW
jgi:hypothetical protein